MNHGSAWTFVCSLFLPWRQWSSGYDEESHLAVVTIMCRSPDEGHLTFECSNTLLLFMTNLLLFTKCKCQQITSSPAVHYIGYVSLFLFTVPLCPWSSVAPAWASARTIFLAVGHWTERHDAFGCWACPVSSLSIHSIHFGHFSRTENNTVLLEHTAYTIWGHT